MSGGQLIGRLPNSLSSAQVSGFSLYVSLIYNVLVFNSLVKCKCHSLWELAKDVSFLVVSGKAVVFCCMFHFFEEETLNSTN